MERAYVIALDAGRKDLQTIAAQALGPAHIVRLELDEAEILLTRGLELAGESGSVRARIGATLSYAWFLRVKGELDAAETMMEEVRQTAEELGMEPVMAGALMKLGWVARAKGELKRSEKLFREALHITAARGDRGMVPDYQAALATTLADLGKVDEAERLALEARANAVPEDTSCQIFAVTALAAIREAQGRDEEAEELFVSAIALGRDSNYRLFELHPLERLLDFLRARGRDDEAATYEERLAELSPYRRHQDGADRLTRTLVRRLGDHRRRALVVHERVPQRIRAERPFTVREVLRLVSIGEGDVGEVDVERRVLVEDRVRRGKRLGERSDVEELPVARRMHVGEIEHRTDPVDATRDLDHVVERAEIPNAAHHLDAERDGAFLLLEALSQCPELLDDRVDRVLSCTSEQEARVEDHELGTGGSRDPRASVESTNG